MNAPPGDEGPLSADLLAAALLDAVFATMGTVREVLHRETVGGLTAPQFRLLVVLREAQPASLSQAAELLHLSRAAASRLVDGLARQGLVERRPSNQDRRRVELRLTEAGRERLLATDRLVVGHVARRLAQLSGDQQALLRAAAELLCSLFGPGPAPFSAAAGRQPPPDPPRVATSPPRP